MQFILDQRAQFASDMQELKARYNEVLGLVGRVAVSQERTNEIVATLAERHAQMAERHAELAGRHAQLAEEQKNTEERLQSLIAAVERHISDHK